MKDRPNAEPDFLGELEAESPDLSAVAVERLPDLAPAAGAPARGRERLLEAVSVLPLRYAPFFARLAALWDLSEDDVTNELVRAKDNEQWRWTALPGIRLFDVQGGAKTSSAAVRLVRFSPGFRFPVHRHKGYERVLILEGSYIDSSGTVYRSGDLHEMSEGSEHGFTVADDEPCVAAVVEEGREFQSVLLRVLAKLARDG
jgi:anti-sigma factor ChrR (cupin superfamily)